MIGTPRICVVCTANRCGTRRVRRNALSIAIILRVEWALFFFSTSCVTRHVRLCRTPPLPLYTLPPVQYGLTATSSHRPAARAQGRCTGVYICVQLGLDRNTNTVMVRAKRGTCRPVCCMGTPHVPRTSIICLLLFLIVYLSVLVHVILLGTALCIGHVTQFHHMHLTRRYRHHRRPSTCTYTEPRLSQSERCRRRPSCRCNCVKTASMQNDPMMPG